jgi:hypothetical protein
LGHKFGDLLRLYTDLSEMPGWHYVEAAKIEAISGRV